MLQHALATEARRTTTCWCSSIRTSTRWASHADGRTCWSTRQSVGADARAHGPGGDVTYHGPGQLVAYPIVTVPDDPPSGPRHVHRLEQVVIDTLGRPRAARRHRLRPGTRASGSTPTDRSPARSPPSACAPCAPARPRRTLHGVALNVDVRSGHVRPHRALRHRRPRRDLAARPRASTSPWTQVVEAVRRPGAGPAFGAGRATADGARRRHRRPPGATVEAARPGSSDRSCAGCARRESHPRRDSTSPRASRHGCGCRCASARATVSSARPCTTSASSRSAKRRDARTSTSAGRTARRPS